jgi:amino acid transporter
MGFWNKLKHLMIGRALPNWEYKHQRLSKTIGLAVFSSDSMSSVAYATEEILMVLVTAGLAILGYSIPIALIILLLLWVLIISYRQTIHAYPKGGGAYSVAKENLGEYPGLVAASALLLDYILTVSVSVAAGVAAVTSAFPIFLHHKVAIGLIVIAIITILNLKGVKESGLIFSIPTYLFIFSFFAMIIVGFIKYFTGNLMPLEHETVVPIAGLSVFLLMRAFSSGCAALTGVEAISNGVQAFKKPESKNAQATLVTMALILTGLFFGITFLAYQYHIIPHHDRTVVSILAEAIFGKTWAFYVIQAFTMLILFLAANTSFADFPRLCFFLAKDTYLPRQFMQLGERLVFSNGIIFLGLASSILIIIFKGSVHLLIPLYAVGVFTSFTLSQTGMVRKNKRERKRKAMFVNLAGAIMTFIALSIIAYTKFLTGAWIIVILIPMLVILFKRIHEHYHDVADQLSVCEVKYPIKLEKGKHLMIVLVPSFHKGVMHALKFANTFCNNVVAVHVDISGSQRDKLLEKWHKYVPKIKLVVLDSPYRLLVNRLTQYLDELEKKDKTLNVTVVIPEFVPKKWWHHILHNQTALALKTAIHFRKRTSYISVQYHLRK